MRAYVKTNNGTFPNLNFYLAWEAFNQMGYSVTCFEEKDIPTLPVTVETPVFAGVTIFRKIIDKLGINYPPFDCYPEVLKPYYGRNLRRSLFGIERDKFHKDGVRVFVKPVLPKQFIGNVWDSLLNLIPLANVPDDAEVWVCEPMDILSEFRVYVNDGDILGVKHYYGDWSIVPQKSFIEEVVKRYRPCPVAYGVDIAVTKPNPRLGYCDVVLEVNDGCNLGNYGLDSIHYGEMIVSRWFEIMSENEVDKEIDDTVELFKGSAYEKDYTKEAYDKPIQEGFDFSRKDMMLKSQCKTAKERAMRAFAAEVQARLKEVEIPLPSDIFEEMKLSEQTLEYWIKRMREIATAAHMGQKRNGGEPYITHPEAVAAMVEDRLKPIALGHDLIEDTTVTLDDLRREGFPSYIINAVDILTHKNKEPNVVYWERIAGNPDALEVKKKDIAHNMGSNPSEHAKQKYTKALAFFAQKSI